MIDPKPAFPVQAAQEVKESFTLEAAPEVAEAPQAKVEEPKAEEPALQLVIKNESVEEPVKIGSHVLTEFEIEEKRRFEEQKRSLEERAERLRRMSFNVKANESNDDLENVPAYVRRNMNIDNSNVASSDTFYSGYSVGTNNQQNNSQASIQTINTFLDGKRPD